MKGEQLPLAVTPRETYSFSSYHPGPNTQAVSTLRELLSPGAGMQLLLHGPAGSGKTHLLQALVNEAAATRLSSSYLHLPSHGGEPPEALAGLENLKLICLDGLDEAPLPEAWTLALARLLDAVRSRGGSLALAARKPAHLLQFARPDLDTRVAACASFGLKPLSDEDRARLLSLRAHARGLHLPDEVAHYLLKHLSRDMRSLLDAVAELDRASLSAQRRLTIPFVQSVLLRS
jgi:DnaA family protein